MSFRKAIGWGDRNNSSTSSQSVRTPVRVRIDVGEHIVALAWSPDGRSVAIAGADGGVSVIDAGTTGSGFDIGSEPLIRRLGRHPQGALTIAFSSDGARIVSGGQDGCVRVFARHGDGERVIELPDAWVGQVSCSDNGLWLAVASGKYLSVYDASSLERLHLYSALPTTIEAFAFAPNGRQIAAASYGGVVLLAPFAPFTVRSLYWKGACLSVAWRPDASVIAAGGQDASVQFWRLPKGYQAQMNGFLGKVREISWNGSGRWLATGGSNDVALWDFKTGPEGRQPRMLSFHSERIVALSWQYRGELLASAARDHSLLIWRPGHGDVPVSGCPLSSRPTVLSWSPDDRLLAIGTDAGELTIVQPEAMRT